MNTSNKMRADDAEHSELNPWEFAVAWGVIFLMAPLAMDGAGCPKKGPFL